MTRQIRYTLKPALVLAVGVCNSCGNISMLWGDFTDFGDMTKKDVNTHEKCKIPYCDGELLYKGIIKAYLEVDPEPQIANVENRDSKKA